MNIGIFVKNFILSWRDTEPVSSTSVNCCLRAMNCLPRTNNRFVKGGGIVWGEAMRVDEERLAIIFDLTLQGIKSIQKWLGLRQKGSQQNVSFYRLLNLRLSCLRAKN